MKKIRNSNNRILTTMLIATLLFVGGCAPNIPLLEENRKNISNVTINPKVDIKNKPVYMSRYHSTIMLMTGILPGLVPVLILQSNGSKKIEKAINNNSISIDKMVFESFKNEVEKKFKPVIMGAESDATFVIQINYGLIPHMGTLSNTVKPQIVINAKLTDKTGQIIWEKRKIAGPNKLDGVNAYSLNDWTKQPEKLENGFKVAIDQAVSKLLAEL